MPGISYLIHTKIIQYNYIIGNSQEPIIISSSPSKASTSEYWIKELHLYPSDEYILLSPVQWLNDSIINAAQMLLHKACDKSGFQNTQLGKRLMFEPIQHGASFIQILHVDSTHWITVTNVACNNTGEVIIYDSRFNGLSMKTKLQVSCLLKISTLALLSSF